MPFGLRLCIDATCGLALVRFSGDVAGPDLVSAAVRLHTHPDWKAHFDVIWDYRAIDSFVILPDELAEIFRARTHASTGRDFIVVKRKLEYMIARLYAYRAQEVGKEVHLCWKMGEVLAGLGLAALPPAMQVCLRRGEAA